jgi:hypothetical protein
MSRPSATRAAVSAITSRLVRWAAPLRSGTQAHQHSLLTAVFASSVSRDLGPRVRPQTHHLWWLTCARFP